MPKRAARPKVKTPSAPVPDSSPAAQESSPGWMLCDVCGGILLAEHAPRHGTHTRAEIIAAHREQRDAEAEAGEQVG